MAALNLVNQTLAATSTAPDSCALILGTQEPDSIITDCHIDGHGAAWALKMPGNSGSIITDTYISGGTERALDIVRGHDLLFKGCTFLAGTDRAPTRSRWSWAKTCDIGIKIASNVAFTACSMTDLLLGDHSIYDNGGKPHGMGAPTSGITLTDCLHPAGKETPIVIRVLNGEMPILVNTNAVVLKYWWPMTEVYFWVAGKWIDSRVGT